MGLKLFTGQDRAIYRTGQSYLQDRTELFTGQDRAIYRTEWLHLNPRYSQGIAHQIAKPFQPTTCLSRMRRKLEFSRKSKGSNTSLSLLTVDIPRKTFILCCYSPATTLLVAGPTLNSISQSNSINHCLYSPVGYSLHLIQACTHSQEEVGGFNGTTLDFGIMI